MREVKTGSQFRKDLKRYRNDKTKREQLYDIVGYLVRCADVPKELNLICFQVIMQVTWNVTSKMIFF